MSSHGARNPFCPSLTALNYLHQVGIYPHAMGRRALGECIIRRVDDPKSQEQASMLRTVREVLAGNSMDFGHLPSEWRHFPRSYIQEHEGPGQVQ